MKDSELELIDRQDELKLLHFGYKQELKRSISILSNIGIAFTILSIPTSLLPFISFGLQTGGNAYPLRSIHSIGPKGMLITWPIVSILSIFVGLSMSEIVSAFPTSGGLYFWAAKLSPPRWAPFISYFTGWFNFLGLWGTTSGTLFDIGELSIALLYVLNILDKEHFPENGYGYKFGVLGLCLVGTLLCGWVNTLSSKALNTIGQVCLVINMIGIFVNVLGTAYGADGPKTSFLELFNIWENRTGFSDSYVWLIGILPAATLFTGYDSTGHLAEETHGADMSAPLAIMSSILLAFPIGFFTFWGLLTPFVPSQYIQLAEDPKSTSSIVDIFVYTQGTIGGTIQTLILITTTLTCSYALIATHARMTYAFARDGGLPYSSYLYKLDEKKIPIRALWMIVALDFLILLPSLYSSRLYEAINSIGTVGTYISYSIPITLRLFKKDFQPGPFNLGKFSFVCGIISVTWLISGSIALMLPLVNIYYDPNVYDSYTDFIYDYLAYFNWSPVMVFLITFFSGLAWFVSVRYWFKGPKKEINLETLEEEESEVDEEERMLVEHFLEKY